MSKTIIITVEVDLDENQLNTKQYDSLYAHAYSAVRSAIDSSGIDYRGYRLRMHHTESLVLTDK